MVHHYYSLAKVGWLTLMQDDNANVPNNQRTLCQEWRDHLLAAPDEGARHFKKYSDIATALGVIGTFGGGFTFATLFSITCSDTRIKKLLEFSSVLFMGTLLASLPVYCAVHALQENTGLPEDIQWFVRFQLIFSALVLLSALLCMFSAMYYFAFASPFILAVIMVACCIVWCIEASVASYYERLTLDQKGNYHPVCLLAVQVLLFIVVLAMAFACAFGNDLRDISRTRCDP
jgi:hypothetical protein